MITLELRKSMGLGKPDPEDIPNECHGCGRDLGDTPPIYLEFHTRNGTWHEPGTLSEEDSQGCFEFGPTCARKHAAGRRLTMPAGCRSIARDRLSGAMRGIYNSAEADLDTDSGKWSVICEDHGAIVGVDTLRSARSSSTIDFCDQCAGLVP